MIRNKIFIVVVAAYGIVLNLLGIRVKLCWFLLSKLPPEIGQTRHKISVIFPILRKCPPFGAMPWGFPLTFVPASVEM
jgi:hypothetical protein